VRCSGVTIVISEVSLKRPRLSPAPQMAGAYANSSGSMRRVAPSSFLANLTTAGRKLRSKSFFYRRLSSWAVLFLHARRGEGLSLTPL
jgi:hypothetical protein